MKKFAILFIVLIMLLAFTACGNAPKSEDSSSNENDIAVQETEKVEDTSTKIEKSIDAIAEYLGFSAGEETFYSIIGAEAGKEYNGGTFELYQFDEKSDVYKAVISGEGSMITASAYKDGFVLIFPEGCEPDQSLIDAFNSIEFK